MNDLASTLGRERDHLLRAGAALQLLPQNATKWARFERLLEVSLAAEPTAGQRAVSSRRLRQLLTTPPIATPQLVAGEDPFEESFTAAMTFYGGTYRVVLGGISGAHAGCQLVLEAVRSLNDDAEREYKREVLRDATVLLKLSDALCDRAGLGRWDTPVHSPRTKLLIPAAPELDRLCNAVSFSQDELSTLLGPAVGGVHALTVPGRLSLIDHDHESPTDDRIYFYPLMEVADGAIVATLPSALAASITARALARASIKVLPIRLSLLSTSRRSRQWAGTLIGCGGGRPLHRDFVSPDSSRSRSTGSTLTSSPTS